MIRPSHIEQFPLFVGEARVGAPFVQLIERDVVIERFDAHAFGSRVLHRMTVAIGYETERAFAALTAADVPIGAFVYARLFDARQFDPAVVVPAGTRLRVELQLHRSTRWYHRLWDFCADRIWPPRATIYVIGFYVPKWKA